MMFNFLKPAPVYIKLYHNKVEVIRLDTGRSIRRVAEHPFSNERLVLADFEVAEKLIRDLLKATDDPKRFIRPALKILIQQMEKTEDGLSSVEERALIDSAEHCGASHVIVVEGNEVLSNSEALNRLNLK